MRAFARSWRSTSIRTRRRSTARTTEADALVVAAAGAREGARACGRRICPPEAGGSNGSFLVYAHLNEEIGRSLWGQLVFGCQAPDAGNGEILWHFGTDEQKERLLKPLVAGEVRSFFSMTEPDVSGSDPRRSGRAPCATATSG